jgi:hypothetical protein
MSEKTLGWIAIGVILGLVGWVYKSELLSERQQQVSILLLLAFGLVYRVVALRAARLTVLMRRRLYKDLWRRGDRSNFDPNEDLNTSEEDSIVLLGRIKGAKSTTTVMAIATIAALLFKANFIALVVGIGQMFLAAKLHLIARTLDRALPADGDRNPDNVEHPQSLSDRYLVEIDIQKVHDFIRPRSALPFWSLAETEQWLAHCGFNSTNGSKWEASSCALRYLDSDEVISIEPAE